WYGLGEARYHVPGGNSSLDSIEPFHRALELDPSFRLAYEHIDDVYSALNKIDEGLATTRRLLEANPEDLSWYREWIGWLVRTGDRSRLDAGVAEAVELTRDPAARRDLLVTLGSDLYEIEAYDDAERYLRQALEFYVDGDDSGILNLLGWVLHDRQRNREAERRFREALELKPLLMPSLSGLLEILTEERRFDEALEFFGAKVAEHPDHLPLYDHWIRSAVLAGDAGELERAIEQGLEKCRNSRQKAHFWLRVSWAYNSAGNPAERLAAAKKAVAALEGADDVLVESTAAWAYYEMRDLDAAETLFSKVLENDPSFGGALSAMAQINAERDNAEESVAFVQRLLEIAPLEPGSRGLMIFAQFQSGNRKAAERYLDEGLALAHTDEDRRKLLTTAVFGFLTGGEIERAAEIGEKAVALDPGKNQTGPRFALAAARMYQGRFDDAERLVSDVLRTHPNDDDTLDLQGAILMARGDLDGAERLYREALENRPPTASKHANLATVLGELGRYDEAVPYARKALEMEPNRTNHALLSCFLIAGDIDVDEGVGVARRGLDVLASVNERMTKSIPTVPPVEECAGLGHLARGESRKAVAMLEKAAELSPDRAVIREYLEEARANR
ncbi:MAG: tetratricopeptide repeat protein, partial [Acidobacteriota bacterium]|nr:tetratricopeptide repeat protein [Acidobacteriota bacterium]